MNILLTNDDGIMSPGLIELAYALQEKHNVYIVAPETEQSAKSQAITIKSEMQLKKHDIEGIVNDAFSLSGTPADCVRVALDVLYKDEIDLVFSGTNRGLNAGADILYSGTVSACVEGNVYKLPGVAVSAEVYEEEPVDFVTAAKYAVDIFEEYKTLIMGRQIVLNINVPHIKEGEIKGVKVCEVGDVIYDSFIIENENENGKTIKGNGRQVREFIEGSDRYYLDKDYVTISPIQYRFNDPELLKIFNGK